MYLGHCWVTQQGTCISYHISYVILCALPTSLNNSIVPIRLFSDIEKRRTIYSPIPVFTSDNWDPFEEGLLNVYGFLEMPYHCGIGRKPNPVLVPYPDLKYAKVCKKRKNGRIIEVIQRIVYGNPVEVMRLLGPDGKPDKN